MESPRPRSARGESRRASVLLLLYLLVGMGLSRTLATMESTAEKLGAISVPVALLAAACWYAFKEGGRGVRVAAATLALLTLGAFGFGVVQGMKHARGGRELDQELAQLRQGLAADAADPELGADAAKRHLARTQAAAGRLQQSEDPDTAAIGRVMAIVGEKVHPTEERLLAALELVGSDRFLDMSGMLVEGDFAWQRETAAEYVAAAQACSSMHAGLPQILRAELDASGLERTAAQQVMTGFQRTWPLSGRAYRAHVASAQAYGNMIAFLEQHRAEVELQEDGSIVCDPPELGAEYNKLLESATAAETELREAATAVDRSVNKL